MNLVKSLCLIVVLFPAICLAALRVCNAISPEARALLEMKSQLDDPENYLANWNSQLSPCEYFGVRCDADMVHVTGISLTNVSLAGRLSSSVAMLFHLSSLEMGSNHLSGALPSELANCTNLQILNLSVNTMTGQLPDLSRLQNLQVLDLSTNKFSGGFPGWIGKLAGLVQLGLGENDFDEGQIPKDIGNLRNLTWLFLGQCNLSGKIPASVFQLTSLGTLDFSRNKISGEIPNAIAGLRNLSKIELYQNKLTGGIPAELAKLSLLSEFDISSNQMSGLLPREIGNLKLLRVFHIFRNNFRGEIPVGFGDMQFLSSFSVYENNLSGAFPSNFGRFSQLNLIDISENRFSGDFPKYLCQGNSLLFLLALDNGFSGRFPDSYSSCKTLQRFRVSQNQFTGEVPHGLWGLPHAVIIDVADNRFTGGISSDIGISATLNQLYVQNNKFSGELPAELGNVSLLQKLVASNNSFSGQLPPQIGNLKLLSYLHLDQNALVGSLPLEIGMCSSLVDLNLAQNSFVGDIPATLASPASLNSLNLSHNCFTGSIPNSLQALKLSYVDFEDNRLSGAIPPQLLVIAGEESFAGNPGLCIDEVIGKWKLSHSNLSSCRWIHGQTYLTKERVIFLWIILLSMILLLSALALFRYRNLKFYQSRSAKKFDEEDSSEWKLQSFHPPALDPEELCNLEEENVIGSGGTGKVYRLDLSKCRGTVAVKQLRDRDNVKVLMAEMRTLGNVRHRNILKLHAFLTGRGSSFLVYEYMPNGNLYQGLRRELKGGQPELDWSRRYTIAVGVAKGIMYLHHDCVPAIIHRDIKSTNILLDEDYEPKLADFGIAKIAEDSELSCFAGTHGYFAPELGYSLKATEKSDVYSFGVVLLELITGRTPLDPRFGGKFDLVAWVAMHVARRNMAEVVDPRLAGHLEDQLVKVLKVAILCTVDSPAVRPTMRDVVKMLVDVESTSTERKAKADMDQLGMSSEAAAF